MSFAVEGLTMLMFDGQNYHRTLHEVVHLANAAYVAFLAKNPTFAVYSCILISILFGIIYLNFLYSVAANPHARLEFPFGGPLCRKQTFDHSEC